MKSHGAAGNIFFYILLGIVLFAALGYAVSRSSIGTKNLDDEKARLAATEIIAYGNQIREAMTKLRLRGCADNQYDFSNNFYKRVGGGTLNDGNTASPADDSCDLFSPAGGNIASYIPAADILTAHDGASATPLPGHGYIRIFQIKNVGTDGAAGTASANDIVFGVRYINPKVCAYINYLLDVTKKDAALPTVTYSGTSGGYTNGSYAATGVWSGTAIEGRKTFCYRNLPTSLEYWQSIVDR